MVPVAYADARILNVGIVVSSSDHTALLKQAKKMPCPIERAIEHDLTWIYLLKGKNRERAPHMYGYVWNIAK